MNWQMAEPDPTPEQLAAYVDGELDRATHERIERWLADHPEPAAEVEGQRQLQRLWKASTPEEPAGDRWGPVLAGIHAGVAGREPPVPGRRKLPHGWGTAGLTTAAGILLALGTWLSLRSSDPPSARPPVSEETLTLASGDDVEIISIAAADVRALVVGQPPLQEPLVLASADDMAVENPQPEADGMIPYVPR